MRNLLSIAMLGWLLQAACGASASQASRAQSLFDRGDYRGAETAADDQLAHEPENPALWRLKIAAAIRSGDSPRGVDLYMQWHKLRRHYDVTALRAMAVSSLWHGLRESDPHARQQAIAAIQARAVSELFGDLEGLLGDRDPAVAATAAVALLGERASADARAVELVRSPDPRVRAIALAGLARATDADQHIIAALADPAPEVRVVAVNALGRDISQATDARLIELARTDGKGAVRAAAVRALARARSAAAADSARAALSDAYLGARLAGLQALASSPDRHRALLIEIARSGDLFVALRAAVALRKAGVAPAINLQWALGHESWNLRVAALNALTALVTPDEAVELASRARTDARIEVSLAAARVLMRLGKTSAAAEVFTRALTAPRDAPRIEAAIDLLRMNDSRGRDALIQLSGSPSPKTRRAAARAHRYTDNPTLPLIRALADAAAPVRVQAADSLLWLLDR